MKYLEESYKTIDIESIPETLDIAGNMPQVYSNNEKCEILQSVPAFPNIPSINSGHTPQDPEIRSGKKKSRPFRFLFNEKIIQEIL